MKKLLFIIGSLRKDGFNYQLAKTTESLLKDKYEISYLKYDNIPYMNQDLETPVLNEISNIRNEVINSDGIIIFTPEYNNSYPGLLKNLLDWLSRPLVYNDYSSGTAVKDKKVAITGIGGKNKTLDARTKLIELLTFMGMNVLEYSAGFQVNAEAWKNNKVILSDGQVEELRLFINKCIEFIDK